jgi:perosamine synthetase
MHKELGFKYQMTNLQAAVGAAQMTKIDKIIKTKREIGAHYLKGLAGVEGIQLPIEETWAKNVYWMFNILLRGKLSGKRREFMAKLKDRGVDTREDFVPFNQQIFFLKEGMTKKSDCPTVNTFYDDGLYLPSGTDISKKEMDYVIEQVKAVVAEMTQ